ncbi:MAG: NAD(+) synthase [Omnitrophica WOR_2 bacterium]
MKETSPEMILNREVFTIDCEAECHRIESLIQQKMAELHRAGIVVSISGGLDSSTVVTLCARAAGKENVTGLILPEKHGNPDAAAFAKKLSGSLGITTALVDISKILSALGTYDFIAERIGLRGIVKEAVRRIPAEQIKEFFLAGMRGNGSAVVRQGLASMYSKHRIRMVVTYKYAEERNLLVVGCAHKSEDLVGLFSKYGVDDNADVMPLKHLYRSQILQLARFLGVPMDIIARTPNPDMLPGIEDKYWDVLGLHSETLDLVLYGLEQGLSCDEIADQLPLELAKVHEIRDLVQSTAHMRHHAFSLLDQNG